MLGRSLQLQPGRPPLETAPAPPSEQRSPVPPRNRTAPHESTENSGKCHLHWVGALGPGIGEEEGLGKLSGCGIVS